MNEHEEALKFFPLKDRVSFVLPIYLELIAMIIAGMKYDFYMVIILLIAAISSQAAYINEFRRRKEDHENNHSD